MANQKFCPPHTEMGFYGALDGTVFFSQGKAADV
jgi:hypothetical protein